MNDVPSHEVSTHALIPPRDSKDFLAVLRSPDSAERSLFREYIIGVLRGKIEDKLLNPQGGVIGFSDQLSSVNEKILMPNLYFNFITSNAGYGLRDPNAFFTMLEERPQDFSTDCLNIIPIMVMWTMRDVLIERGYNKTDVDELLTDMEFAGNLTTVTLNNQITTPFLTDPDLYKLYKQAFKNRGRWSKKLFSFSRMRPTRITAVLGENGNSIDKSQGVTINGDMKTGDFFAISNKGATEREDYGHTDAQNGIVLTDVTTGETGDEVSVFAHQESVADRRTDFVGVLNKLIIEALRSDRQPPITIDEFLRNGGIKCGIFEIDYVGFYEALTAQLDGNKKLSFPWSRRSRVA